MSETTSQQAKRGIKLLFGRQAVMQSDQRNIRHVGMIPTRIYQVRGLLLHFLTGQIAVQAINLFSGFFLLRWLLVQAYAQYSVAFAFQCTLGMLIDLGFSNSIVALVGNRTADETVVGNYIHAAKSFRRKMFMLMVPLSAIAFPLVTHNQPWSIPIKASLFGAIIASIFFQGGNMYAAPLLIRRHVKQYYRAQIVSAFVRFLLLAVLYLLGLLSACATAWIAALALGINGWLFQKSAKPLINEPKQSSPEHKSEMLRYLTPLIPGLIFTAFQGQITIGIITIVGHVQSIAEVAALGRLAQLFSLLAACNSVLVEPYVAKLSSQYLTRGYLKIFGLASLLSIALTCFAFMFPEPLLWFLGSKYNHLHKDVGWLVMASCINYLAGVLWVMNSARKWISWWYTGIYIFSVTLSQVCYAAFIPLRETHSVILFSLMTSCIIAIVHLFVGIQGLVCTQQTASATDEVRNISPQNCPSNSIASK